MNFCKHCAGQTKHMCKPKYTPSGLWFQCLLEQSCKRWHLTALAQDRCLLTITWNRFPLHHHSEGAQPRPALGTARKGTSPSEATAIYVCTDKYKNRRSWRIMNRTRFLKLGLFRYKSTLLTQSSIRFDICMQSCNQHHCHNPSATKFPYVPLCRHPPPLASGHHWYALVPYRLAFPECNHVVYSLLSLASSTHNNTLKFQPCYCIYQQRLSFWCWVTFHCIDVPQFACTFINESMFGDCAL